MAGVATCPALPHGDWAASRCERVRVKFVGQSTVAGSLSCCELGSVRCLACWGVRMDRKSKAGDIW